MATVTLTEQCIRCAKVGPRNKTIVSASITVVGETKTALQALKVWREAHASECAGVKV